ncbi:MAG: His/Gly/Thr/Pro-type tRNA ligase C-terminal domain-containing protein [Patescibacteria group bacterium]
MSKIINKIDSIDHIAEHYGFKKAQTPVSYVSGNLSFHPEEKPSILKSHYSSILQNRSGKVTMLYHGEPLLKNKRIPFDENFKKINLDIIGVHRSIAEATIIHTAIVALGEEGFKNTRVNINSLGDKDSSDRFKEELFNFYRGNIEHIPPKCRNFTKNNIFDWFCCGHKECSELKSEAPKPIYFLSDHSRRHLKSTLEILESLGIVYQIDDTLISPQNHFSKIVFEIKGVRNKEDFLLGRGGRYDELAQKITKKKFMPAVGVSLEFLRLKKDVVKPIYQNRPKFYFIQFGSEAKVRSLPIIEKIRDAHIEVKQDLHIDKFTEQIQRAQKLAFPYLLILGQKEVAENTIIVKDLRAASQKTIEVEELLPYLKTLV